MRKQAETLAAFSAAQQAAPQLASGTLAAKKKKVTHSWCIVDDATGEVYEDDCGPRRAQLRTIDADHLKQQLEEDKVAEQERDDLRAEQEVRGRGEQEQQRVMHRLRRESLHAQWEDTRLPLVHAILNEHPTRNAPPVTVAECERTGLRLRDIVKYEGTLFRIDQLFAINVPLMQEAAYEHAVITNIKGMRFSVLTSTLQRVQGGVWQV